MWAVTGDTVDTVCLLEGDRGGRTSVSWGTDDELLVRGLVYE